jgi:hypothetical protein
LTCVLILFWILKTQLSNISVDLLIESGSVSNSVPILEEVAGTTPAICAQYGLWNKVPRVSEFVLKNNDKVCAYQIYHLKKTFWTIFVQFVLCIVCGFLLSKHKGTAN